LEELKDEAKGVRLSELPEETSYLIKKELIESIQGWSSKQVEELIMNKSGIKHNILTYIIYFVNMILSRRSEKVTY